ncbi:nuclear transport factor 2 family protein [Streptomyces geranii]|uniref:nuclear transport factor 2 family protein n=1 Tax=Streptomyces geranii TaxID=2058923 RepID=UPI000D0253CD|nr:nuclear transport factor 2 family protein [Streptomyces geranii]
MTTHTASFLGNWFAILDSDDADRILDLISDDFSFSILFSTGDDGATDFHGGRPELEGYLAQRSVGVRTHHRLTASTVGQDELFLGEVRRSGVPEATFVASARLDDEGRVRRLLIGRSPAVLFT